MIIAPKGRYLPLYISINMIKLDWCKIELQSPKLFIYDVGGFTILETFYSLYDSLAFLLAIKSH